jgi:predicted HAD superfamily Cof-like phosphohydrolase
MDIFDDVGAFHHKMGLQAYDPHKPPYWPAEYVFLHRIAFLHEELDELVSAHRQQDLVAAADAIADLIWVACGAAHLLNIPLDAVWNEVRRANMEKRPWRPDDPVKPRNLIHEIVKPNGWRGPDIYRALYGH